MLLYHQVQLYVVNSHTCSEGELSESTAKGLETSSPNITNISAHTVLSCCVVSSCERVSSFHFLDVTLKTIAVPNYLIIYYYLITSVQMRELHLQQSVL